MFLMMETLFRLPLFFMTKKTGTLSDSRFLYKDELLIFHLSHTNV